MISKRLAETFLLSPGVIDLKITGDKTLLDILQKQTQRITRQNMAVVPKKSVK
jgi:hypothetical protein